MTTATLTAQVEIVNDDVAIDGTYFKGSDVAPFIRNNSLVIQNWKGARRGWGAPTVSSVVSQLAETVIMVKVTGWHKHTVSPVGGCFYFVNIDGEWTRKMASAKIVKQALGKA